MSEALIALLADGEFHSGEELGEVLGVSRTAVWKQLQKLSALGLELESVKGRGYRLEGGLELFSPAALRSFLPEGKSGLVDQLNIFLQTDSTNSEAAKQIAKASAHGYCCVAEQQTAGRGRRGRQWLSPFGRNLYLSKVWEFEHGASALEGLSLSVGLAVLRALRGLGVSDLGLKWPNDILLGGKKLAGILLEMQGDPAGVCQVIIGIGVNLDMRFTDTSDIDQPWADLTAFGLSRNQVLAAVLLHLEETMLEFAGQGFAAHRDEWRKFDIFAGAEVSVQLGENWLLGVADGVERDGALAVVIDGERRLFHGGEVSLRRRHG
ncbi:bifunctional biotin--[acetyl-CoA-carboxylase] ligase/biotin operon repressor BirA [Spongiibacter sp. KMU-158]|uniref:Bifunctional ligase/repressor BirA n=1 Tax=Spongiibacter pelagi TaxID=2760804 RepID=A0A927C3G5_9GAMM|nr:bifunctional biotin--[acetyl-CoA-carboxylase] ligase/biotin operon repressor BirA [Spongiibacter pelagi]MBD2859312.1 bifunctional biotin--[acetyl-CoA-carboxylase] ligase/biotin operon repressor BirA [Spongiibacter pelagi]